MTALDIFPVAIDVIGFQKGSFSMFLDEVICEFSGLMDVADQTQVVDFGTTYQGSTGDLRKIQTYQNFLQTL